MLTATAPNQRWAMDVMSDALANGRQFRVLNVIHTFTRQSLAGEADTSLPAVRVISVLEAIALERGYPDRIVIDNGPEFRSVQLDAWAYAHKVTLDSIQPGKPVQNALIESYNGRMRDELLHLHWWRTVAEAQGGVDLYREDYNELRPRSALGNQTPNEFARRYAATLNPERLASSTASALGANHNVRILARVVPEFRNALAHGGTMMALTGLSALVLFCDLINPLFPHP